MDCRFTLQISKLRWKKIVGFAILIESQLANNEALYYRNNLAIIVATNIDFGQNLFLILLSHKSEITFSLGGICMFLGIDLYPPIWVHFRDNQYAGQRATSVYANIARWVASIV